MKTFKFFSGFYILQMLGGSLLLANIWLSPHIYSSREQLVFGLITALLMAGITAMRYMSYHLRKKTNRQLLVREHSESGNYQPR